ncbi:hypothetical protein CROQUDRAFT_93050 [Cronartium quercuum f. sp. fusiforme G11]|uniref:Uncharacterized protein n=1 Tax=Cronartium quercuum f. sp. fusiforme G11 TaxID=708437 RepID=A0A9P6NHP7_9BASI|nr:hypothetical protein CROQUDRAFT_93050 [Cronartium quercuum f. sp. fusiforme G11]
MLCVTTPDLVMWRVTASRPPPNVKLTMIWGRIPLGGQPCAFGRPSILKFGSLSSQKLLSFRPLFLNGEEDLDFVRVSTGDETWAKIHTRIPPSPAIDEGAIVILIRTPTHAWSPMVLNLLLDIPNV